MSSRQCLLRAHTTLVNEWRRNTKRNDPICYCYKDHYALISVRARYSRIINTRVCVCVCTPWVAWLLLLISLSVSRSIYQSIPQPGDHRGQEVNLQRPEVCMKHHQCHQDPWPQHRGAAGAEKTQTKWMGVYVFACTSVGARLHLFRCEHEGREWWLK